MNHTKSKHDENSVDQKKFETPNVSKAKNILRGELLSPDKTLDLAKKLKDEKAFNYARRLVERRRNHIIGNFPNGFVWLDFLSSLNHFITRHSTFGSLDRRHCFYVFRVSAEFFAKSLTVNCNFYVRNKFFSRLEQRKSAKIT